MNFHVTDHSWTSRLAKKRRSVGRGSRAWLRLAFFLPTIVALRALRALGFEIAIYPDHFGHQAMDVEHHLRRLATSKAWSLYLAGDLVPNAYLYEKHRALLRIARLPDSLMRHLRGAEKMAIRTFGFSLFYVYGFEEKLADWSTWNDVPPQIQFTAEDHRRGEALLARLGLERGRYVCLHARDAAYGLSHHTAMWVARGGAYAPNEEAARDVSEKSEDSLFNRYRNSNFVDYRDALAILQRRGLKGVRVGAKADRDLTGVLPNLVDFAGCERDKLGDDADFADIYLMAHCQFYVGTSTGVTGSALLFNRPMIWLNAFPWPWGLYPPVAGSLYLPKLWRANDGHVLTFREMFEREQRFNWRPLYRDDFILEQKFCVIDNTPDEIAAGVAEMADRLEGTWQSNAEDEKRQSKMHAFGRDRPPPPDIRIPREFLVRHETLLD
jgi:putative glycosyltransferase (TIGR04372 family)